MSSLDISVTTADMLHYNWETVLESCEARLCDYYEMCLSEEASKAEQRQDRQCQQVYTFLALLASPVLTADVKGEPMSARVILSNGQRTFMPDDLNDDQLSVLTDLAPSVRDAELRARFYDILWLRTGHNMLLARKAAESYLESATTVARTEYWPLATRRFDRALQLALFLKDAPFHSTIVKAIEAVLNECHEHSSPFFLATFMELLQKYKVGDATKYALVATNVAVTAEQTRTWHVARTYWELAAQWHDYVKDQGPRHDALLRHAEMWVMDANDVAESEQPSYLVVTSHLTRAIEALRRLKGTRERVTELHRRLLVYQKKLAGEMRVISAEINITQLVEQATAHVKGKTLYEALLALALLGAPPSIAFLRSRVVDLAGQFPLSQRLAMSFVTDQGKTTARKPSMFSSTPSDVEAATLAAMRQQAVYYQGLQAQAFIEPAREQINRDHQVRPEDLIPLLSSHPFIPAGRELVFARGLHAGLVGDFLLSTHLLIPQIENSIRHLLSQRAVITSTYSNEGIQEEFDLNRLLWLKEVQDIFGEDLVFDLQGILAVRSATNLRNRAAHGLLSHDDFYSLQTSYFWWLTLRLCCIPILAAIAQEGVDVAEKEQEAQT